VFGKLARIRLGILERAYRRLGPAYPTVSTTLELTGGLIVAVVGALFLRLYVDMTADQLVGVILAAAVAAATTFPFSVLRGRRMLLPVREWIAGDRTPRKSVEAWRAAIAFPLDVWPRTWYVQATVIVVVFTVATAVILSLTPLGILGIFGISWLAVGYGAVLDFYTLEGLLRPVVADISKTLPPDFSFGRAELSLRTKLFLSLPFINVLTGIVVAGLASNGENQISDLGADVLAATLVAFTVSLLLVSRLTESLLRPLNDLIGAASKVETGDYSARVPVTTSDEAGQVARSFNRMVAGLAEREEIREAFGTYVDPEVARRVIADGTSLAGEEVEITALFLDVRDFTGFAERNRPTEVVATLNRLFEIAVPIIHEQGGHVDKFVGDGLLAVFGAPRRQENHADCAFEAACRIAAEVEGAFDGELNVGLGMSSGPVVAGNVGGGGRLEFSVVGDAVNVAARVEAATRETGDVILVSETTRNLLSKPEGLVERRGVTLKGKHEHVCVYAVET
jgi:class 3 adenylate cyclase